MKEKYYTPFFQTIYVFHFLFVLNDLKSYGCEICSSKNDLGSAKTLYQCIYFFIFKTKVIFMFKFYIFTPFTSINHILLI
jgi:hypothetical protein